MKYNLFIFKSISTHSTGCFAHKALKYAKQVLGVVPCNLHFFSFYFQVFQFELTKTSDTLCKNYIQVFEILNQPAQYSFIYFFFYLKKPIVLLSHKCIGMLKNDEIHVQ